MTMIEIDFNLGIKPPKRIIVGFSGGMDSTVLLHRLHVMCELDKWPFSILAVYVNHGLSVFAQAWENQCLHFCQSRNIHFQAVEVSLDPDSNAHSLEHAARVARYQALETYMQDDDILVTAHHRDDQAETLLLQLFRGAGVAGCSAMPVLKRIERGYHWRPLLSYSREELKSYANEQGLAWIDDDSNTNTRFDRNFLRHEVMPTLVKRWPGLVSSLARSAEHFATANTILNDCAHSDYLASHLSTQIAHLAFDTLDCEKIQALSAGRQASLLRYWIVKNGFPSPNTMRLRTIMDTVLNASPDSTPCVHWQDVQINRYRDALFVQRRIPSLESRTCVIPWDGVTVLKLGDPFGELFPMKDMAGVGLSVRFRVGGETLMLPGRNGHKSLKKYFQEWGVPTWLRDFWPLIYQNEQIIAVPGFYSFPVAFNCRI